MVLFTRPLGDVVPLRIALGYNGATLGTLLAVRPWGCDPAPYDIPDVSKKQSKEWLFSSQHPPTLDTNMNINTNMKLNMNMTVNPMWI